MEPNDNYKTGMHDKLAYASDKPDIQELNFEFKRSVYNGSFATGLEEIDDIRFCRWDGQSDDGKKYSDIRSNGSPAMPFEGASDVRIRLIDRVINEVVALCINTWKASKIRVTGNTVEDAAFATACSTLLQHVIGGRLRIESLREAKLLANYANTYGWSAAFVGWQQEIGKRENKVTMVQLQEICNMALQENPESTLGQLPNYIMDEGSKDLAVSLLQLAVEGVDEVEMGRMVDELRQFGETKVFIETITKNLPVITALKPYDEICFPPETIELQKARVIFRRVYMTEVEILSMVRTDGWDEQYIETALNTAGKTAWYNDPNITPPVMLLDNREYRNNNLVEVVYAYTRQIDESGTPCIYYTAFTPQSNSDGFFIHKKLGYAHNQYPFVPYRKEYIRKSINQSRGIPEILMTEQAEMKAQHDALRDRTSVETFPPILVKRRAQGLTKIGPAVQVPIMSPDDFRFMEPPAGTPNLAFNIIQQVEKNAAMYFGISNELVPQTTTQLIQQSIVDDWLTVWAEIYTHIVQLCLQYMAPEELERITAVALPQNITDIASQFDFEVKFDVRDLDNEYVMKKMQAISQFVLPMDAGGAIDRNKLVALLVEAISPDIAKNIIIDQATASQKMYRDVQTDIALMLMGLEAQYTENDPTAPSKLQYAQDIIQKNPKAQQALQGDQFFQALFQNYAKNLQMSIQQQQNAQIGRTGVTPVSDEFMQEQQQAQYEAAQEQQGQQQNIQ
jgi:hypothetical protein